MTALKLLIFSLVITPDLCAQHMPLIYPRLKARQFCGEFSRSIGMDSQLRLVMSGTSQAGLLNLFQNWKKSIVGARSLLLTFLGCWRKVSHSSGMRFEKRNGLRWAPRMLCERSECLVCKTHSLLQTNKPTRLMFPQLGVYAPFSQQLRMRTRLDYFAVI